MLVEQDSKSEENGKLRPAKAGHSSNICLSSPNAPVLQSYYYKVADRNGPGLVQMATFLNWEVMGPHAKPENPVQLGIFQWCTIDSQ